jgi:hypothetical protein
MPKDEASHPVWNSKMVLALIPILFGVVLFVVERNISDASANALHVWLQFVTTNWPNWHGSFDRASVSFAVAVSIRVALADSLVAGIWVTFTRMVAWNREHTIRYADALRLRDHAIETELLNLLPAEARALGLAGVRNAFEDASRVWENEHLPTMLGPELAKEFISHLHEQEIGR